MSVYHRLHSHIVTHLVIHFFLFFFFFNDTATTEIYTLSLHDALPIAGGAGPRWGARGAGRAARDAGKHLPEARKTRAGGFAARRGPRPTALALRTRQCRSSPKPGGARPAARRPSPG